MGLASLVLCAFVMSDDEMLAPPSEAIHRPGEPYTRNRMVFAQGSHDQLPDEDGDIEQPFGPDVVELPDDLHARMEARAHADTLMVDGRGRGDRSGWTAKVSYEQTAYDHKCEIESGAMGRLCRPSCIFGQQCGLNITPANLLRAHRAVYGDQTTATFADGLPVIYNCTRPFGEVQRERRKVVLSSVKYDAANPDQRVERFFVDSIGPVCAGRSRTGEGCMHM
jgi:hypothetical protein